MPHARRGLRRGAFGHLLTGNLVLVGRPWLSACGAAGVATDFFFSVSKGSFLGLHRFEWLKPDLI